MMKKLLSFSMLALLTGWILAPLQGNAQIIFNEDFDGIPGPTAGGAGTYVFPAGWFLRNVDNGTVAAGVSWVNEAWERREDYATAVSDSAAFSTSWNTPVVTANDWMWTPLIGPLPSGSILSWNALTYDPSYPDGYEVRVMVSSSGPPTGGTGVIGNQITGSTSIFSIAAENTTWTARNVSLASYAGQSVYIGFRNNSTDEFLLLIDDVKVEAPVTNDAEMAAADTLEYTIIPLRQYTGIPFNGTIRNGGSNTLNSVYMTVNVYDGLGTMVFTGNSATTATLAPAGTANFTVTGFVPTVADFYTFEYISRHAVTDGQPVDDTLYRGVLVDDQQYARDDGTVTGGLGIGTGEGYLGQEFDIAVADVVDTVLVYVTAGYTGMPFAGSIWSVVAGVPSTMVAVTDTMIYPDDSARVYEMPILGGGFGLAPGTYLFAFDEIDSTMQVGQTAAIFTAGDHWVDWATIPSGTWTQIESFGAAFSRASVIRPYLSCGDYTLDFNITDASCGLTNGQAQVLINGGVVSTVTYNWSSGSTTDTQTGLGAGAYDVTVTAYGTCVLTGTAVVSNTGAPTLDSLNVVDALCNGDDGSVCVVASGGTPVYTYLWSNGATTDCITAAAGTYTVTVTDGAGCDLVAGPATISEPAALSATVTSTDESAPGAGDGSATASPSGGTPPYTYLWSTGGTTATISGLSPGTYTCTVTDDNGCTFTGSTDVITGNTEVSRDPLAVAVFPNPNEGVFTIFINLATPADVYYEVHDALGRVLMSETVESTTGVKRDIADSKLSKGIYFLRGHAGNQSFTRRIVVK